MRIGVDLDGVCYDFVSALRHYLVTNLDHLPAALPDAEVWDFFTHQWGMTEDEFLSHYAAAVDSCVVFVHGDPVKGCVEALTELRADGHTVHIVTHRKVGTVPLANTEYWLREHKIPYDTLTFAEDKTVVPCDVFLEDHPGNYDALEQAGCQPYLFDRPWNRDHPGRRVTSWAAFAKVVLNPEPTLEDICADFIADKRVVLWPNESWNVSEEKGQEAAGRWLAGQIRGARAVAKGE